MKLWPPAQIVAVLNVPGLDWTEYPTTPLPEPLLPEVIVTHTELLCAVQLHPAPALIVKLPVPPFDEIEAVDDESEYAQPDC